MPVDNKVIKKALDDFENDDFMSAKDAIKAEIGGAVSDYYKEKLDLQGDLGATTEKPETETKTETDVKAGGDSE